jgi:hypothetical protein
VIDHDPDEALRDLARSIHHSIEILGRSRTAGVLGAIALDLAGEPRAVADGARCRRRPGRRRAAP